MAGFSVPQACAQDAIGYSPVQGSGSQAASPPVIQAATLSSSASFNGRARPTPQRRDSFSQNQASGLWDDYVDNVTGVRNPRTSQGSVQDPMPDQNQDPSVSAGIARGQVAFESSCTVCHDASRSTEKVKTHAGWLGTVRRMAGKNGADIARGDMAAIAEYLTSLSQPPAGDSEMSGVELQPTANR